MGFGVEAQPHAVSRPILRREEGISDAAPLGKRPYRAPHAREL